MKIQPPNPTIPIDNSHSIHPSLTIPLVLILPPPTEIPNNGESKVSVVDKRDLSKQYLITIPNKTRLNQIEKAKNTMKLMEPKLMKAHGNQHNLNSISRTLLEDITIPTEDNCNLQFIGKGRKVEGRENLELGFC